MMFEEIYYVNLFHFQDPISQNSSLCDIEVNSSPNASKRYPVTIISPFKRKSRFSKSESAPKRRRLWDMSTSDSM